MQRRSRASLEKPIGRIASALAPSTRNAPAPGPCGEGWPCRSLPLLLMAALACLVAGLTLPVMEVRHFWVFRGSYSIFDGILLLLHEGDILIASVITAFSIVVPALKIMVLLGVWQGMRRGRPVSGRLMAVLETIGKWSMLDVFVVALLVFSAKASTFVDATVQTAVVPFMASIFLTIYCTRRIRRGLAARALEDRLSARPMSSGHGTPPEPR